MIIIDKEQFEIETNENNEEKETKIKIKKIYRIMRKIAEAKIKGRTGEC
jgi:hypothetical protein